MSAAFPPLGLSLKEAARHLGMGRTLFDGQAFQNSGAGIANANIRVNWLAIGW